MVKLASRVASRVSAWYLLDYKPFLIDWYYGEINPKINAWYFVATWVEVDCPGVQIPINIWKCKPREILLGCPRVSAWYYGEISSKIGQTWAIDIFEISPGFCLGIAYWIECKRLIIAVLQGLFNRLIVGGPSAL